MNTQDIIDIVSLSGLDILDEQIYDDGMDMNITLTVEYTYDEGKISNELWDEVEDRLELWTRWLIINRDNNTIQAGVEADF